MASIVSLLGLLVIIVLHTLFAAVATRFFRLRLETTWGMLVYVVFLIPVVLVLSTMLLSGPLGLGTDLGSQQLVLTVVVALPLALGFTIDVFWMPHPDEVEVPGIDD